MQLSQKETSLLKDLKGQEKLCVDKYTKHASCAADPQLKDLFTQIAKTEQQHLDTITKMESGSVPAPGGGSQSQPSFSATYGTAETPEKQADCYLCTDVLSTEKHASHLYDSCIFEFKDENARNTLNHIQKEEQNHGKQIYDYMAANAMYS
ncbi:MAG: ferritin-like domain-containing protein [Oscillospiraceae bacterium]|nr:ferritin-like domain-containing protein [Oscillospiraceae bacterium]